MSKRQIETSKIITMQNLFYDIGQIAKVIKDMIMMTGSVDAECFEDFESAVHEMLDKMSGFSQQIIAMATEGSEIDC